jgi:hypothetical protein
MFIFKSLPAASLLLIAFSMASSVASAQNREDRRNAKADRKADKRKQVNDIIRAEEEGTIAYNKEWTMGGRLYTDGFGFFYQSGKMKTVTKTNWWSIEMGTRKHPKEQRLSTDGGGGGGVFFGTPLIFGKQNVFLFTKVGFGGQTLLGGKGNKNGVAVSAIYGGGLSLGMLKPYVVNYRDPLDGLTRQGSFRGDNSRTDSLIIDPTSVVGSAGFFKGFNEIKFAPGVFAKGAIRFDYGRYNELVSAFQCGFNVEFYSRTMPIMAKNDPKRLFVNLFVGFEFGRRK